MLLPYLHPEWRLPEVAKIGLGDGWTSSLRLSSRGARLVGGGWVAGTTGAGGSGQRPAHTQMCCISTVYACLNPMGVQWRSLSSAG